MKDSNIYGSMVKSFEDLRSTLSKEFSVDKLSNGKGTSFGTVMLVGVGLMIFLVLLFGSTSVEPFTYMLEDGREGERLTGKIKDIGGSHLEKKCYGSTGIYYGDKVPKNLEGFSVNDDRRIMGDNLSGSVRINKASEYCCCLNGKCLKPQDCPPCVPTGSCDDCVKNCK